MGIYLNPPADGFEDILKDDIYVDKTELIAYTNQVLGTTRKLTCFSRPRRFGKSFAAQMLVAYYSKGTKSEHLFKDLKIAKDIEEKSHYKQYLNQCDVLFWDMTWFITNARNIEDTVKDLQRKIIFELKREFTDCIEQETIALPEALLQISAVTGRKFFIIIDEWDALFREAKTDQRLQEEYIQLLRGLFKGIQVSRFLSGAYMTGILPIKKYGTQSALTDFYEYTMLEPGPLAEFVGFTEQEVKKLCEQYGMDMEEVKNWYDGYSFDGVLSVYSPRSVVNSMRFRKISNYWNQTETFEALQMYIDMNFEHLKDDVLSMIAGESVAVNTESFTNDMATFRTEDDVLTLLIHLGYLAYDDKTKTVKIPNSEIRAEYVNTVSVSDWGSVSKALKDSADTLNAIWQGREEQVSKAIEQAHFETSHIQYNDENALSYTISLALYAARNFYTTYRELAGGKGFADLVFIPKKQFAEKPALVVELKWDKSAEGAIKQIKDKKYFESLEEYKNNMLLVGINYDRKTKTHECKIEKLK